MVAMTLMPYNQDKHRIQLIEILDKRKMPNDMVLTLPEFGVVVTVQDKVVACGFIRKVEGNFAMLDSFMTDPEARPEDRFKALDLVAYKLVAVARANNFKKLICFTIEDSIKERIGAYGFEPVPHLVLVNDNKTASRVIKSVT